MSYTEFGPSTNFSGVIQLAMCDLSNPARPACHNGSDGRITGTGAPASPYFTVAQADPNFCENEGAYPAVDTNTGDVYVAYEHNWFTGLFACGSSASNPLGEPTQNVMNFVPFSCLANTPTSPCSGPAATQGVNITSLEAAFIPGYNRFPASDFPRVAVSNPAGTVSMVWNDGRLNGTGDIFLQSFNLGGSLAPVAGQPVRINARKDSSGWQFLPAVRQADDRGTLNVSFYSRDSQNTANTDVHIATRVDPRMSSPPTGSNTQITTGSSNWLTISSIIIPNFGDYTDNYVAAGTLFVAWSDGRLGFPQPFEDNVGVH